MCIWISRQNKLPSNWLQKYAHRKVSELKFEMKDVCIVKKILTKKQNYENSILVDLRHLNLTVCWRIIDFNWKRWIETEWREENNIVSNTRGWWMSHHQNREKCVDFVRESVQLTSWSECWMWVNTQMSIKYISRSTSGGTHSSIWNVKRFI